MIESEKAFIGDGSNGKIKLDRYYLHGRSGATVLDIGAYSTLMAEGNIYDSKFTGVRAQFGGPVKYTAEVGKMDAAHRASAFTATYATDDYLLEGGWYHFDSVYGGAPRTIYMANFRKPMGWFDFGAMFLHGVDRDKGSGNGYVLTLSHGREDSWNPGTYSVYAKYYHQPASTYIVSGYESTEDYEQPNLQALVTSMQHGVFDSKGRVRKGAVLVMHMSSTAGFTPRALDLLLTVNEQRPDTDPAKFKVGRLADYLTGDYSQRMRVNMDLR